MTLNGKANILLVDDQAQKLLSYEAILEPLDENLIRAGSGREALEILLKQEVAVVLLDVVMPGMDGFETASTVRSHPRFQNLPIIFVTAISTSDMAQLKGYELGAVDYVYVPVVPAILRAKVAAFVELFHKRRELQLLNRDLELRVTQRTEELQKALTELEIHAGKLEREIAERRRLERELRIHADELAEADRRKNDFLAMLAHELRNPLAPIRSAIEILHLRGPIEPILQQARDVIDRQVTHMTRLIDDLLDVSRITRGKVQLYKQRVELDGIVRRALEITRPLIEGRNHKLSVTLPSQPVWLEADATRMAQVVANLLNNAAKFTEPGGQIWLVGELCNEEVMLRVRDTGVGIPSDVLPHIFDLFIQADRTLDRSQGGLGIGLTLVHWLVEMHGGTVVATSEGPGQGSEFVVRLPVLVHINSEPAPETLETQRQAGEFVEPARLRVLVVDDNEDVAETLAMLLTELGHEVQVVNDGPQALTAVSQFRPELIFLDIGLPGMTGYEVAQQIRTLPNGDTPVIVALSGYGQESDQLRSLAAGFDHHLVKPAGLEVLEPLLASVTCDAVNRNTREYDGTAIGRRSD